MNGTGYEDFTSFFSETAFLKTVAAIKKSGGNEVFLGGTCKNDKETIEDVTPLFFGNREQVLTEPNVIGSYDIVLHNHPSGVLEPSSADMSFAAFCRENGVGFAIFDNDCEQLYFVVPLVSVKKILPVSDVEIDSALRGKAAKVRKSLPGYSERGVQVELSHDIAETMNKAGISLLEAPTGVGKSLAYMIAGAMYARKNREKIVLTTNTIALQHQLMSKDYPVVRDSLDSDLKCGILVGRGNYLCRYRYASARENRASLFFADDEDLFGRLDEWIKSTGSGTLQDIAVLVTDDVWNEIRAERVLCLKMRCPYYQNCFYYASRKELATADMIVVNHYLFLMNELNGGESDLLPPYGSVIFDEAHNLPDVLETVSTEEITFNGLSYSLNKLAGPGGAAPGRNSGYLSMLVGKGTFKKTEHAERCDDLTTAIRKNLFDFRNILAMSRDRLVELARSLGEGNSSGSTLIVKKGDKNMYALLEGMSELRTCSAQIAVERKNLIEFLDSISFSDAVENEYLLLVTESYLSFFVKFDEMLHSIEAVANGTETLEDDEEIFWVETREKDLVFYRYDNNSADRLSEHLSSHGNRSALFLSATMTSAGSFGYFKNELRLNSLSGRIVHEKSYPYVFDYANNAAIMLPIDIPSPQESGFISSAARLAGDIVKVSKGSCMILTTSFSDVGHLASYLDQTAGREGITVLAQGRGLTPKRLIQLFCENRRSVLIATMGFWEGIDLPGDILTVLVITKMPFKVPSHPIFVSKSERLTRQNKKPFMELSVPNAVLKLKQGFGRLIRRADDKGVCIILDNRLVSKQYGALFLSSLPPAPQIKVKEKEFLPLFKKIYGDLKIG